MEDLPSYIAAVFLITTLATIWIFYKASDNSRPVLFILLGWALLQSVIGLTGFYTDTTSLPPRFLLLVLPPLLFIIGLFITSGGRKYIDRLDIKMLTILHVVRIPVELVLFWLFIHKTIPEIMTFEGRNFDILSGLTAPLIWYFGFVKKRLSNGIILIWNFICLGLLVNIVAHAILSAPFPFQKFGFDHPNIAVFHFPYLLLPGIIVPLVFLSHLVVIRKLLRNK